MITVSDHPDGAIVAVQALPGAKRNEILGERGGALRVAVSSPPDKGKANAALMRYLAEVLDCKQSQLALVAGGTSRKKLFLVNGISSDQLRSRIERVLPAATPKSE